MAQQPVQTLQTHRGIVKQIFSGDCLIIRGQPRGGPPPERTLALSYINAPKLARRANPNFEGSTETKEEPYAWEAREFLRKMLVGKEVTFSPEHKTSGGREYGSVWMNKGVEKVNIADLLVSEGLVEVRQTNVRPSEDLSRLIQLENDAKAQNKGKWSKTAPQNAVRKVTWNIENLRQFVEKNHGKQLDAVVEHVRDGCTLRVIILPSFQIVTAAMTGIKCPTFKREGDQEVPEPFAEQSKFFTESRLLQRDVKLQIEGISSQNIVLATVIHPAGNIAELLLKEGFGWCVDWSMGMVLKDKDKLRAAEKLAKENKLRHWKDYEPSPAAVATLSFTTKNFSGKVMEIVNADALVVKTDKNVFQKIHFSSLRPPRKSEESVESGARQEKTRPLYDIPYMFEAREFLRKKLIGKRVTVAVDYVKPAQDHFPERIYCTVTREGINIGEALISKGLGRCLRHGRNDDQRSSHYDDLLTAENRAEKNKKGVHSKKESTLHRVADVSGDPGKAKQFLPFLQRAGRTTGLVEFVASGSRTRMYLPKDTCLITFILAGISCPRAASTSDKQKIPSEPYGQEALMYTKEQIMQREVDVEVETCDKGGNFIGWLFHGGKNLAVSLVEEGYCKVLPQAERSSYARQLFAAEESAKISRKRIWENYVEPKDEEEDEEKDEGETENQESKRIINGGTKSTPVERKVDYKKVVITEVVSCNHFWAQNVEQGPALDTLMQQLQSDLQATPPLPGSYNPHKGQLCAAQFSDGQWYRAHVEKVVSPKEVHVLYIDFGNREIVPSSRTAPLPQGYNSQPPQAKEYHLACIQPPSDDEWAQEAKIYFTKEVLKEVLLNFEYRVQGQEYVTVVHCTDEKEDIGEQLLKEGLVSVQKRKDKRLQSLLTSYIATEEKARKSHVNLWQYGDFTGDEDSKEFGYQKY